MKVGTRRFKNFFFFYIFYVHHKKGLVLFLLKCFYPCSKLRSLRCLKSLNLKLEAIIFYAIQFHVRLSIKSVKKSLTLKTTLSWIIVYQACSHKIVCLFILIENVWEVDFYCVDSMEHQYPAEKAKFILFLEAVSVVCLCSTHWRHFFF